jgi:hypothetical protein
MQQIIGIDVTKVRTAAQGAEFIVGTVGSADESGALYKYVKYNAGAGNVAAVAGNFVYNYAPSGASAGAFTEVTSDLTDSGGIGMGVLQAVIADDGFGWIQITGYAVLAQTIEDTPVDGGPLTAIGAAADGAISTVAAGAAGSWCCGVTIDASEKKVFLQCPL